MQTNKQLISEVAKDIKKFESDDIETIHWAYTAYRLGSRLEAADSLNDALLADQAYQVDRKWWQFWKRN